MSSSSSSSSVLIQHVNQLKVSLSKELDRSEESNIERCSDILSQLEQCDMNLNILSETLVGVVVGKFKTHKDSTLSSKAKNLIQKWKTLAKLGEDQGGKDTKKNISVKSIPPPQQQASQTNNKESMTKGDDHSTRRHLESLPPNRRIIAEKFLELLTIKSNDSENSGDTTTTADDDDNDIISIPNLVINIELAIHNYSRNDRTIYTDKARSLLFNMKKNSNVRDEVLVGSITPEQLVQMRPEQLATVETTQQRQQLMKDLHDSRRLDWDQANESKINEMCGIKGDLLKASLFKCGRCKSEKTTSTQKQTRYVIYIYIYVNIRYVVENINNNNNLSSVFSP